MRICIAAPSLDEYSETFIKSHIERLPFDIVTLSGPHLDRSSGKSLAEETRWQKAVHYIPRKLGRFDQSKYRSERQAAFLKTHHVRALLAEYGYSGTKLMDACAKAGIPLIVYFFGYDAYNRESTEPLRDAYKLMFKQAAAIISVSQPMVAKLTELGAPQEKIHYVPPFANLALFPKAAPTEAPPVFLSVGRFVEKKAPYLTLLAFSKVLDEVPEARLEMAGDGPLFGPCKRLAHALGIAHAVTFHGVVSHEWFGQASRRVRCFVQHSLEASNGDSEGTPVAVLEAQCSGLPVVATRHNGIADIVVPGVTGYLCEEGDAQSMANDMLKVLRLSNKELEAMSLAARERIANDFGDTQTIDRLASIINKAVQAV